MTFVSLPIEARSVVTARRFLREALIRHDVRTTGATAADAAESILLMTSELVANAVCRSRTILRLGVEIDETTVRVSVVDDAPGRPTVGARADNATSGRGLILVDALSTNWGYFSRDGTKTVWFEKVLPDRDDTRAR